MKRGILIVLAACGAALVLVPATAPAGGETTATLVTYTGSPAEGSEISVAAAAGQQNIVGVEWIDHLEPFDQGGAIISDTGASVDEDSPFCMAASPTEVRCLGEGLERMQIDSGDRDDEVGIKAGPDVPDYIPWDLFLGEGDDSGKLRWATFPSSRVLAANHAWGCYHFRGQAGNDEIVTRIVRSSSRARARAGAGPRPPQCLEGNGGKDKLTIKRGRGKIKGGGGGDKLKAGGGPQTILGNSGGDAIGCGKGKDKGNGGPGTDTHLGGCERFSDFEDSRPIG